MWRRGVGACSGLATPLAVARVEQRGGAGSRASTPLLSKSCQASPGRKNAKPRPCCSLTRVTPISLESAGSRQQPAEPAQRQPQTEAAGLCGRRPQSAFDASPMTRRSPQQAAGEEEGGAPPDAAAAAAAADELGPPRISEDLRPV